MRKLEAVHVSRLSCVALLMGRANKNKKDTLTVKRKMMSFYSKVGDHRTVRQKSGFLFTLVFVTMFCN